MDRWLLSGAGLLFFFECLFFLGDLGYLPQLRIFSSTAVQQELKPIGNVVHTFQNVKRKNQTSLVWEDSEKNDLLFENDAVLTLKNSSTQLKLEGDITLDIQQNTLVVLEVPEEDKNKNLLLRFSKGHLRGKSRNQNFRLGHGDWRFEAHAGSHIAVRSTTENQIEMEVSEGEVEVLHPQLGRHKVQQGQRLQIENNRLQDIETLSSEVRWKSPSEMKVYSHRFPAKIQLEWEGEAQELIVKTQLQTPRSHSVAKQSAFETELDPGHYFVHLRNRQGRSGTVSLQVLPAPRFIYLAPLPRDRVKTEAPLDFFWMRPEGASGYKVEIAREPEFEQVWKTLESGTPGLPYRFPEEGDFFWRVQAYDPEGFEIPAPYVYPIFSLENPLSPPKIKPPENRPVRLPAKETSIQQRIWNWIFPAVYAASEEDFERALVFSWYPVPDADFYIVEISSQPDFIQPEVIQTVKGTRFEWKNFDHKIYYFRVAGGQTNGRKGLFSDPMTVDLSQLSELTPGEIQPGVEYLAQKKSPPTKPTDATMKESSDKSEQEKVAPASPSPDPLPPTSSDVEFQVRTYFGGSYLYSKSEGADFSSHIQNFSQGFIGLKVNVPMKKSGSVKLQGSYSPLKWKPKNAAEFQTEQKENLIKAALLYRSYRSRWGLGVGYQDWGYLEREGPESVELKTKSVWGLAFDTQADLNENWRTHHAGQLTFWGGDTLLQLNNHLDFLFSGDKLSIGPRLELVYFKTQSDFSRFQYQIGVLFGVHF